jgi:hypothetical protein
MLIVHRFIEVTSADEVFGLSMQAEVSANLHTLFKLKNEVIVETDFKHPSSSHTLNVLLSIQGGSSLRTCCNRCVFALTWREIY